MKRNPDGSIPADQMATKKMATIKREKGCATKASVSFETPGVKQAKGQRRTTEEKKIIREKIKVGEKGYEKYTLVENDLKTKFYHLIETHRKRQRGNGYSTEEIDRLGTVIGEHILAGISRKGACALERVQPAMIDQWIELGREGDPGFEEFSFKIHLAQALLEGALVKNLVDSGFAWQRFAWVLERRYPEWRQDYLNPNTEDNQFNSIMKQLLMNSQDQGILVGTPDETNGERKIVTNLAGQFTKPENRHEHPEFQERPRDNNGQFISEPHEVGHEQIK